MVDKSNFENNESKNDPFGLMIACEGPTTASKVDFWKLIIQ
jgi:protein tyrosine phosphatase